MLDILSLHTKVNMQSPVVHSQLWSHMTGVPLDKDSTSLSPYRQLVPLLLKDLVAQLLHIIMVLPLSLQLGQWGESGDGVEGCLCGGLKGVCVGGGGVGG